MGVTLGVRGIAGFVPSWISSCGPNPTINQVLDSLDEGSQVKEFQRFGASSLANVHLDGVDDNIQISDYINNTTGPIGIVLEEGVWDISSEIEVRSGVTIRGLERSGTILKASQLMTAVFTSANPVNDVIIENLTIDCDNINATSGIQFYSGGNRNIIFRNINVINIDGTWGVRIGAIVNTQNVLTGLDIDDIFWQNDNVVRVFFTGNPDLSNVLKYQLLDISGASNSIHNGQWFIVDINDSADYVDIVNNQIFDNTNDESSSPATADIDISPHILDKSFNITIQGCFLEGFRNTTLEQMILVNCEDFEVSRNQYSGNETSACSLSVFGYCRNGYVSNNLFTAVSAVPTLREMIVQHSDHIVFEKNRITIDPNNDRNVLGLDIVNASNIWVDRNNFVSGYTVGNSTDGIRIYDFADATFDTHPVLPEHVDTKQVDILNNHFVGNYSMIVVPGQTQSDKRQRQNAIRIIGNHGDELQGMPIVIGHSNNENIYDITVFDNHIKSWRGADLGYIWMTGNSSNPLRQINVLYNTAPASADAAHKYGITGNYVEHSRIIGNDVEGAGSREAIFLQNDNKNIIAMNQAINGIAYDGLDNEISLNITS